MKKTITSLINEQGCRIYGVHEVLAEQQSFFDNVCNSKIPYDCIDQTMWKEFFPERVLQIHPVLEPLEGELTADEVYKALLDSENNKSPGSDGIPIDFYKVF